MLVLQNYAQHQSRSPGRLGHQKTTPKGLLYLCCLSSPLTAIFIYLGWITNSLHFLSPHAYLNVCITQT